MGSSASLLLDCGVIHKRFRTFKMLRFGFTISLRSPDLPRDIKSLVPKQTPTWGTEPGNESSAKATWLGYVVIHHDTPVPFGRHQMLTAVFL
jgi:hypothetical protein